MTTDTFFSPFVKMHVPAKFVLCYPRLLIRTLAYKDTKVLVLAVSLYPRFTVKLHVFCFLVKHILVVAMGLPM
jgi:hypothetical protein